MAKRYGRTTILINSAYRNNPGTSSSTDFVYTFPENVKNVVHTNLLTAVIENGIYNVESGTNDTFNLNSYTPNSEVLATSVSPYVGIPELGEHTFPISITTGTSGYTVGSAITGSYEQSPTPAISFTGTVVSCLESTPGSFPLCDLIMNVLDLPPAPETPTTELYTFSGLGIDKVINPVILTPGYYNVKTLSDAITIGLNNLCPIPTSVFFTEVNSRGIMIITNTKVSNWSISFPQIGFQTMTGFQTYATQDGFPTIVPDNNVNPPYIVRGFTEMYLANYDMLLIQSDRLGNEIRSRQGFDAWWSILNGNTLSDSTTITYDNTRAPTLDCVWRVPRDLEYIDIRLIDIYGTVVNIGSNNNIQLVIECYTDDDARR